MVPREISSHEYVLGIIPQLAPVARRLLADRDRLHNAQAGIMPQQMQDMVGQYQQVLNPDFGIQSLPDQLRSLADDWEKRQPDPREFAAATMFVLMHLAYTQVFDLYETTYDQLDFVLSGTVALAQRLGTKTED